MSDDRRKVLEKFEANRAELDRAVADGIEAHRKGGAQITVTGADGKPAAGAQISVHQKNHAFRYGANLFMLDELETPEKKRSLQRRVPENFQHGDAAILLGYTGAGGGQAALRKGQPENLPPPCARPVHRILQAKRH